MSEGKPIYDPGALLLDYFDDFEHRNMAPGVVPVARVESTSRSFYRLYVPFFLQENRRKKLGAVEGGLSAFHLKYLGIFPATSRRPVLYRVLPIFQGFGAWMR